MDSVEIKNNGKKKKKKIEDNLTYISEYDGKVNTSDISQLFAGGEYFICGGPGCRWIKDEYLCK